MENLIKNLRNRLDLIEEEDQFDNELMEEITLLLETSELIKSLGKWDDEQGRYQDEQGVKLAKFLHEKYRVSDQAVLVPYTHDSGNLELMLFKSHYDNFTLLHGPNGWAAFKPKTEYLRKKLEQPGYNPKYDKKLRYVGIFSLEQPSENAKPLQQGKTFFTQTIEATRGGRYDRPEKKGVKTGPTMADQLKDHIGKKGIKVYRLMERDPEEIEKLDPRMLMGRRSGDIPTVASVQRKKILTRTYNQTDQELIKIITKRFSKIKTKILRKIEIRLARANDVDNTMIKRLKSDPNYFQETFWPSLIESLFEKTDLDTKYPEIGKKIEDYKKEYNDTTSSPKSIILKLAAGKDPKIWNHLIQELKNIFEKRAKYGY